MRGDIRAWGYREGSGYQGEMDLIGFQVEATDGRVGRVIQVGSTSDGMSYLVVDTGPCIFGKHVMLAAGGVSPIDLARSAVLVDRTRQEIKDAPEFDPALRLPEPDYLERLGGYHSSLYGIRRS